MVGQLHAPAALPPEIRWYRRLGGPPGPVWTGGENFAFTGTRSPDRLVHSESYTNVILLIFYFALYLNDRSIVIVTALPIVIVTALPIGRPKKNHRLISYISPGFSLLRNCQTCSETRPASQSVGNGAVSLELKRPGWKTEDSPPSCAKINNRGAVLPNPPTT